ncbi:A/G-specific adenine glycosylase [Enterococcus diestrammenae]|uniref:Adenine DNA glycosylase n=1 Tax=Enterococcus diestrammenae TaxID=1155073 RepID=A0ABV0F304_9ENTE|nr:A/G-specific adenine glycosylase [Enterococcus diestrammenae]KAF1298927.1 A/G-specific adenine glycosylase [Enterococcus diestrammenae]
MKNEPWNELSPVVIQQLQEEFLDWYDRHKRNLPWRVNTDPYRVWISEIMLQQTRVDTVIDYYYRFMTLFPTIVDLAAAEEAELLKVWEGLGYYSRARNLQAAAQQIVTDYAGKMPGTPEAIASLKGIGPYTTGAIASISFGLPEPAIDGNVMRVVSRLFEITDDIAKASSRKVFDAAMRKIISHDAPGDFNQAMMDLGSSICTPKNPQCPKCPLKNFCQSFQQDQVANYPVKTKKQPPKPLYYLAMAIENEEHEFLLVQRPATGLLAKMWTFPLIEVTQEEYQHYKKTFKSLQATREEQLELLVAEEPDNYEGSPVAAHLPDTVVWQKRHLGEITHVFSHLKWHVLLFYGRAKDCELSLVSEADWVAEADFSQRVFPKPQQKLVALLDKNFGANKDS